MTFFDREFISFGCKKRTSECTSSYNDGSKQVEKNQINIEIKVLFFELSQLIAFSGFSTHTHDKTKLLSPAPLHLLIIFMPNPCLRGGSLMLGLVVFGEQIYISQHPHVKTINYFVMILSSLTDDF